MVLKIYGPPIWAAVQRVMLVCQEKNVPYEVINVKIESKEWKSSAWKEKQPFGQTPYIDDDGFILYESRAIGRYIATKYASQGTPLIPTDLNSLALFEQAASTEIYAFDSYVLPLAIEKIYKVQRSETSDDVYAERLLKTLEEKLDVYDIILGKQKYLAGNEITLADIFHIPYGNVLSNEIGLKSLEERPNVARWWKDLVSRPSWQVVKDAH